MVIVVVVHTTLNINSTTKTTPPPHHSYALPWSADALLRRLLRSGQRDWLYAGSRHHDMHHERCGA